MWFFSLPVWTDMIVYITFWQLAMYLYWAPVIYAVEWLIIIKVAISNNDDLVYKALWDWFALTMLYDSISVDSKGDIPNVSPKEFRWSECAYILGLL